MPPDSTPQTISLAARIESLLFWKAEPLSEKEIAKSLDASVEDVSAALSELKTALEGRGIVLVSHAGEHSLATHPSMGPAIEKLVKEELSKDLGKAGLETLAIVVYHGPVARSEVDRIRGVNSSFILRSLQVRGLVERKTDPKDERRYTYAPTLRLLQFLGVASLEELPEYVDIRGALESFVASDTATDQMPNQTQSDAA